MKKNSNKTNVDSYDPTGSKYKEVINQISKDASTALMNILQPNNSRCIFMLIDKSLNINGKLVNTAELPDNFNNIIPLESYERRLIQIHNNMSQLIKNFNSGKGINGYNTEEIDNNINKYGNRNYELKILKTYDYSTNYIDIFEDYIDLVIEYDTWHSKNLKFGTNYNDNPAMWRLVQLKRAGGEEWIKYVERHFNISIKGSKYDHDIGIKNITADELAHYTNSMHNIIPPKRVNITADDLF